MKYSLGTRTSPPTNFFTHFPKPPIFYCNGIVYFWKFYTSPKPVRNLFFLLTFALLLTRAATAQEPYYRNIGINEGLPSTEVYDVMQDSKGYLWFSTDAGVCRFNGRSFSIFNSDNGLPDNTVFKLLEDKQGRIWMACYNGKVCYYKDGRINSIEANQQLQKELHSGSFLIISMQVGAGDTLWLGTTRTLYKIAPADNYKRLAADSSYSDSANFIVKVFPDGNAIHSAFRKGSRFRADGSALLFELVRDKMKGHAFIHVESGQFQPNFKSIVAGSGTVLFTYEQTLYAVSSDGKLRKYSFPQSIILLDKDKEGNVWVGLAKGGVYRYANGNTDAAPTVFLDKISISGVLEDNEHGIWFTTLEKGLYYSPFDNYYRFYKEPPLCEKITGLGTVGGNVWVSNYKNEIFTIGPDGTVKQVGFTSPGGSVNYTFCPYNDKVIICGTSIAEADAGKGTVKYYKNKEGGNISGIAMTRLPGGKLACIAYAGLYEFDNGIAALKLRLPSRGTCMIKTKDDKLWIGTLKGLYRLSDTSFVQVTDPSLQNERITSLSEDANGRLFACTRTKGVFIFENYKWTSISTADGLSSNFCNYVLPDSSGIWVATNKGISFLKPERPDEITTIDITDGLPSNEVISLARRGGSLFAGTRNGLCEIRTDRPFVNQVLSDIYVSAVSVNGREAAPGNNRIWAHDENNLRLYIDCISFKSMFSPKYFYRLKGFDDTLKNSSSEFLEYTNLKPGSYTLELYSINNNGAVSRDAASFPFTIRIPWWSAWWFVLLEIAAAIAAVVLIIRVRVRQVTAREEEKARVSQALMEHQMTALRAQMNPHFIFNAINSIQNFILKERTQQAYDYLAKFSKLIRTVLNNSKESLVTLEQELDTLKMYAELEQLRFENKFDFSVEVDKQIDVSEVKVPTMLIQPFVENAIWHGIMPLEGKRQGKVKVTIIPVSDQLKITIEDNGIGRDPSVKKDPSHMSMGMMITGQRLKLLKRAEKDESWIIIEDLRDASGNPCGTSVNIIVPVIQE